VWEVRTEPLDWWPVTLCEMIHSHCLAQLNVNNSVLGNHVNKVLSKVTLIASLLVPKSLICGIWSMKLPVPGWERMLFLPFSLLIFAVLLRGVFDHCYMV
jgi:magnesium transporter